MSDTPMPTHAELLAIMDASDADYEAGRLIPADEVHRMIQERIDRAEDRRRAGRPHSAASPRL